ncbi:MAG: putative Oxidoreductase with FAD/NAD(P)-binding domain [Phycisphaerales bacterium]|nr:putative Oxidoreductase with FAD/NAD(P)-binding domain [Phycisphaerales bacterium]
MPPVFARAMLDTAPSSTPDLAIIGGGAAGLTAAIFAAQAAGSGKGILLLDTAKSLGAKILVAGGGRCNVTHERVTPADFNGAPTIVRNILAAFDADAAVRWFASLGVELKREETGKLFPVTDSARTVLNALLHRCEELGVTILTGCRITAIAPPTDGTAYFTLEITANAMGRWGDREMRSKASDRAPSSPPTPPSPHPPTTFLRATRLLLATGGRSLPKTGSDGSGWLLAQQLNHTVTDTHAALVPLVLDNNKFFHAQLSGLSQIVELSTYASNKRIDRRTGSLLWTHFGISGPVVMDASRHWVIATESGAAAELRCNFLPGETFETTERCLIDAATARPRASIATILGERLPQRVADALLAHVKLIPTTPLAQLPRDARRTLAHGLTALPLPVVQHRGWNYAEVTAGGVPLAEIDYRTLRSRKHPNLYLAGELLDCDGRIGGFNFQWAWATGYLAGTAAGKGVETPTDRKT